VSGASTPPCPAGIVGVAAEDAGAAGGVVNVAHQIGGSVGLGITVAVFAAVAGTGASEPATLAHAAGISLMVAAGLLAVSFVVALLLIVRPDAQRRRAAAPATMRFPGAPPLPQLPAQPGERSIAISRKKGLENNV
jgi:hypothetical protein